MMRFNVANLWYGRRWQALSVCLLPFSFIFSLIVYLRIVFYRFGLIPQMHHPVPVMVVGNIVAGGTGKTPFVIWLANLLRQYGYKPGVVSRGYGGVEPATPVLIDANTSTAIAGDEAILLARRTGCPVVVCRRRNRAIQVLLEDQQCDVIISDDGLQHYAMGRQFEVAIVDGNRKFGNGFMFPAGPLREPVSRLKSVDLVITTNGSQADNAMSFEPLEFVSVSDEVNVKSIHDFNGKRIHAVAGIGDPDRFFMGLKKLGCIVESHAYPDHYAYQEGDLDFNDDYPVIMTEKDAVKCGHLANKNAWYLRVRAVMNTIDVERSILKSLQRSSAYATGNA